MADMGFLKNELDLTVFWPEFAQSLPTLIRLPLMVKNLPIRVTVLGFSG